MCLHIGVVSVPKRYDLKIKTPKYEIVINGTKQNCLFYTINTFFFVKMKKKYVNCLFVLIYAKLKTEVQNGTVYNGTSRFNELYKIIFNVIDIGLPK